MRIYNLFPLLAGRFQDWTPHFERAAEMGFDWIFVNPIQKLGRSGSLYSIADYFQLNPLLLNPRSRRSPEAQAKAAVKSAERKGLQMMVDLVINHCAADSALVKEHPEWFLHEPDGSISHPFCMEDGQQVTWHDLARFDHQHTSDPEGLYHYIYSVVDYLIGLGFKGFRCDAAYQIPAQIWRRLISDVKSKHPEIVFTAETLGCSPDETRQTAGAGFDYVYNSSKWWDFNSPWLLEQYHLTRESVPSIGFPESHDTQRLFEEFHGNLDAMKQRYLFAAVFSAGVMMTMGFEFGFRNKLHVVETRPDDWEETDVDLSSFIQQVNGFKSRNPIFQEDGPVNLVGCDNPNILLLWKASNNGRQEALLILNKDPWNRQYFRADNLSHYIQNGAPLIDLSPDYPLDFIPAPYEFELLPGMGRVMVTSGTH